MQTVTRAPSGALERDTARARPAEQTRPGWRTGLAGAMKRYGPYAEAALGAVTAIGMLLTIWAALVYAPTDLIEGPVQRIFYIHVPMAWLAYLAFFLVAAASVMYLITRDDRWDWFARANAEIGAVFTTFVLITGSLWGKSFWGAWWVWDARLTTTLILWFIYVVYLVVRSFWGRTAQGARNAAVYGILAFFVVPINYEAVTWWRTLHPSEVLPLGGTPQLPPAMVIALLLSLGAFTLLFAFLLLQVYRLERAQATVERLRAQLEEE